MNEYWVIPTNGKWVHVYADEYIVENTTVVFKKESNVIGVFFVSNIVGISKHEILQNPVSKNVSNTCTMTQEDFDRFVDSL